MFKFAWAATAVVAFAPLVAAAQSAPLPAPPSAPPLSLPADHEVGWLGAATAVQDIQKCAPGARAEQVERWRSTSSSSTAFHDRSAGRAVTVRGDVWLCLNMSPEGYAQIPVSVLAQAVRVQGPPPDRLLPFYTAMQAELARTGLARGLGGAKNGKRMTVYVSIQEGAVTQLAVRSASIDAAAVKEADFPVQLAEPIESVTTTGSNREGQVDLLMGVLAPRPLRGNHLLVAGTPDTGRKDFAGTTWRSLRSPGEFLTFEPGGVALIKTRTGTALGSWVKDRNAVYFENKGTYFSGELRPLDNVEVLDTVTRRAAFIRRLPAAASSGIAPSSRETPEFRGRDVYFSVDNKAAMDTAERVWRGRADGARAGIDQQRTQRLSEPESAEWDARSTVWSLCPGTMQVDVDILAELDKASAPELCRAFVGTRRAWQAIVRDGCNGRCLPFNFPMLP